VENVSLTMAKNQYEEIEYIAEEIIKLIRDRGYRYRDIGVITKNLDTYSSLCKAIFSEYEIPVFIDDKKDITGDIFIKYVLSILEIFAKNWTYESVFNYLKSGIVNIDRVYELENYCLKWNIKGRKWYERQWNFESQENFTKEQNEVIMPLLELKQSLIGAKTADQISKKLYKFIVENTENKEVEVESFNIVVEVLEEIAYLFENEKMSFDTYTRLLKTGISGKEIGQIPQTQDKVTIGDVNRSKTHKVKAIFIIGVNDGIFPSIPSSEGFFGDKDREKLKEEGIELAKGTIEKMYEENFNIYKTFSSAEERVYISYPVADIDDKPLRRSTMISKIKKIFPKIKENVYKQNNEISTKKVTFSKLLSNVNNMKGNWYEIYKWYRNNEEWSYRLDKALDGLDYTNIPEKISKENVQKLYGDILHTTVSRLETYRQCGFSYYLKYGLKLSEKEKMDIKPVDTGSFMHNVIDTFFKKVENVKKLTDEQIQDVLNKIIEEELSMPRSHIFTLTAKYRTLVKRLEKVVFLSMKYIISSLRYSEFDVLQTELEFGNKEYPPIEMTLDSGKRVSIAGKIDRIDIARTINGKYIRIIDYKSSTKDIELNQVVSGLQLQLLTYVDAVVQKQNVKPAGALYFTLLEPKLIGNRKNMTKEEIEETIKKNYKMDGLILADVNVIKMMDKTLETGKSQIIPVELNNSGEINYKNSKTVTEEEFEKLQKYTVKLIKQRTVTEEEFERLQKYTVKLIKQISKEILEGEIKLKPYYILSGKKTPCKYCKYKSICGFNPRLAENNYMYVGNRPRQEILDEIKKM